MARYGTVPATRNMAGLESLDRPELAARGVTEQIAQMQRRFYIYKDPQRKVLLQIQTLIFRHFLERCNSHCAISGNAG